MNTRPHKIIDIMAKLEPSQRLQLERYLYVPGKPNFKSVADYLKGEGFRISVNSVSAWWKAEGASKYPYIPAQGGLNALLALTMAEYQMLVEIATMDEIRDRRRVALAEMAAREDTQNQKGAIAFSQMLRELEKSIRSTAEKIHNLEVRLDQKGLIMAISNQTIAYLLQTLKAEGLENINIENLETIGDAVIERIAIENRVMNNEG